MKKYIKKEIIKNEEILDHIICDVCKKEINSTCVSHSIPKFILKNISRTGNLYT